MSTPRGILMIASRQNAGKPTLEPDPAGYVRLLLPLQYPVIADEVQVRVLEPQEALGYEADALVFNRTVLSDEQTVERIAQHCRNTGMLLIYDLDDALLNIPRSHVDFEHYKKLFPVITRSIECADHVWVSSQALKHAVERVNASIEVIPNALDERLFVRGEAPADNCVTRFVYMGTITHAEDVALLKEPVQKALKKFGDRVAFSLIGGVPGHNFFAGWERVQVLPAAARSYPSFMSWLSVTNHWTAGLAPLQDTEFNRAKSYLKYLDYAALGLPGIFSDVECFRTVVRDRANGLMRGASAEAWFDAISVMVENPEQRDRMAQAAHQDFLQHHSLAARSANDLERWRRLIPEPRGIRRLSAMWPERGGTGVAGAHGLLNRIVIAERFLSGSGIEIGALQNPLKLPRQAKVKYVDRMSKEDLWTHYPELRGQNLVEVDVIDDGERLLTFADGELDFIVANHFLEHCQDPIQTLENFLRVLRPGGVIYLAVPNKRFSFDKDRASTTLEHLIEDHQRGPDTSRRFHFEEWVRLVEPHFGRAYATTPVVQQRVNELEGMDYSIHFHNWAPEDFRPFLEYLVRHLRFRIELFEALGDEMVTVLRAETPQTARQPDGHRGVVSRAARTAAVPTSP